MTSPHDTERLREVFTDAAYNITPSPVPLAAIEQAGRSRHRRHTTAMATACALLLIPLAATAVHLATPTPTLAPIAQQPTNTTTSVQVVTPGERVQAAPGVQLWLTQDGKHWSTPEKADQFRSVTDGNLSRPGVSVQIETVQGRYFLSGIYAGKGNPATVKVVTDQGTVAGRIVLLAGQPGWGAWYATGKLTGMSSIERTFVASVTFSDATGHIIASLNLPDRTSRLRSPSSMSR